MNGGLTQQELEMRKIKARNLDAALKFLSGRMDSERLLAVEKILRKDLHEQGN